MSMDFLQTLGGVIRFLEVEKEPLSRPRDKLLARRTWWHRELLKYSELKEQNLIQEDIDGTKIIEIDKLVDQLNELRVIQSLDVKLVESILEKIRIQLH
jgi:hypothetical protein